VPGQAPWAEDQALIEAFLRGDAAALRLVDTWIDAVLRSHLGPPRPYRDDFRQEVKLRLLQCLRKSAFHGNSSLKTFVHHIAVNVSVDFLRRKKIRRWDLPRPSAGADAESVYAAIELARAILAPLPADDRLLMWLVFGEQYSYAEVARRLGKSEGAVRVRAHRCRRSLRSRFPEN
jgi:RNA polymerase sigma-70 factor (ECF subfamily)